MEGMDPLLDEGWRGVIVLGPSGGLRVWTMAPWRWVNAVSTAVVVLF